MHSFSSQRPSRAAWRDNFGENHDAKRRSRSSQYTPWGEESQWTTISGVKYATFWDVRTKDWEVGDEVVFDVTSGALLIGQPNILQARNIRKYQPEVTYLTNACGEMTGNGEIVLEEDDLNKVAFEGGPDLVLPYIAEIDGQAYVLGNLEVAFQHENWDNERLMSEADAALYCKAACEYIRPRLKEGQKLFLADDEYPDRNIIQVAIPLSTMRNAEATTAALKDAFGVVASLPAMPFVDEAQVETQASDFIDLTPTWGEWGNLYRHLAQRGESAALTALDGDFAKAMAAAQALKMIQASLSPAQQETVAKTMKSEMSKQISV